MGIPTDQEARWHGVLVPFFGRATWFHPGGATFSLKTGAPLLPSFHVRDGRRHRIVYLPAILPDAEAGEAAVRDMTARYAAALESMIRRHPEHWFWLHKRWKRAPKGEDGLPRRMSADAFAAEGGEN